MRVAGVWIPATSTPPLMVIGVVAPADPPTKLGPILPVGLPLVPTSGTLAGLPDEPLDGSSGGFMDHVVPVLGAIGFIVGVASKVHPYTRTAGFLIAAGIAVLNYGSEPAGSGVTTDTSSIQTNPNNWASPGFASF